jgi:hypothetical protein
LKERQPFPVAFLTSCLRGKEMNNIFVINNKQINLNEDILVIESKSGLPVVKFNGFCLSSQYDPIREAKRLANQHYRKNHAHVLFGLSFSYLAKEILNKMAESDFLLIIEPSNRLFEEVKARGGLEPLINHNRVFFIVNYDNQQIEEEIKFLVSADYNAQIEIIISPNYEKLYSQYIKNLEETIKKNIKLSIMNLGTISFFSKIWQKNLLYNLYDSWRSLPFKVFNNRFTCPVIIVSSGPSLTKQLEYLRTVKEKESALIIAAGSTINPLLKAGIKPHIVVSIDGGEANWGHFKSIQYDDIPLFYSLTVHKDIPKHHKGYRVVYNAGDGALSNWVNKTLGTDLDIMMGGPSVSNYCFYIAKKISSGPITFIGQDLSYTNNRTHAEGNNHFTRVSEKEFKNSKRYVTVEGYYGGEVVSDYQFLGMKRVFEDMVSHFRDNGDERLFFNSTEGGALIQGITNLDFKRFINNYCNFCYEEVFKEAFKPYELDIKQKEHIKINLELEKENLKDVIRIAKKAIEILEGTSKERTFVDVSVLKKLDKLDGKLNQYLKNNVIHYIMMPINFRINHIYQEGLNETPLEQTKRILNKSEALYKGILEAAEETLKILNEILNDHLAEE